MMNRTQKLLHPLCLLLLLVLTAHTHSQADYSASIKAWNQPQKPFQIIGNIYYVGTINLGCYLIKTRDGLILLDTALQESGPQLRANIESLGFKLKDIKIMLSSHSHFDHVAGHADMKAATGAQVYSTAADAEILESGGQKGFHPIKPFYKQVKVDKILKDGSNVRLGEIIMTAHLTPGHTEGNTAWTMKVTENGKQYNVLFTSSMSINPGVRMVNNPTWAGVGAQPNPFIESQSFRDFIADNEKNYLEHVQREQKEK
jgi:metallo-beta-lactamase class B